MIVCVWGGGCTVYETVTECLLFCRLAKTADTLYTLGSESLLLGDEEKAYIHFMKFMNTCSCM